MENIEIAHDTETINETLDNTQVNTQTEETTEEEEWRAMGHHRISSLGRVKRVFLDGSERFVKGSLDRCGYKFFQVRENGKQKNIYIHRIVQQLFVGPRPAGLVIDHINRNPQDNRLCNLRYVTPKENVRNSSRFHSDILLEGQERLNYLAKMYRQRRGEEYLQYQRDYKKRRKEALLNQLLQQQQIIQQVEN